MLTKMKSTLDIFRDTVYNILVNKAELPVLTVRLSLNGQYVSKDS